LYSNMAARSSCFLNKAWAAFKDLVLIQYLTFTTLLSSFALIAGTAFASDWSTSSQMVL
jgi:hypothetical protein